MADDPKRVDPPSCGCTDCLTGYSVPLNLATWQTVKAMIHGDVQDATGTKLDVMVVVTPAAERDWEDGQVWKWKYDAGAEAKLAAIAAYIDGRAGEVGDRLGIFLRPDDVRIDAAGILKIIRES
jgi:hypothetical protein